MKRIKAITCVLVVSMTMMICGCGKNSGEVASNAKAEEIVSEEILISDEQAVSAIRNYCCKLNPDLESIAAEEYPVYWEIVSSDNSEVVVLFRSYTGAQVRYYVDRSTGNTTVTEFVPVIMEKEEPSGESFNVKDYMN